MATKLDNSELFDEIRSRLKQASLTRNFVFKEQVQSEVNKISVLQWNILAQALSYPEGNFNRVTKDIVNYESRKWRILEQILIRRPDLIALEEVDIYHCFLKEHLEKFGYDCFFTAKPNSRCLLFQDNTEDFKGPDGVLLCYRTDKFDLSGKKNAPLPDDGRHAKQVFSILELVHKSTKVPLVFVGTHFKAKKQFADSRKNQANALVAYLDENYDPNTNIILVGDFNGDKDEACYKVICDGRFQSSYRVLNGDQEPSFTTWKFKAREGVEKEEKKTIDFIFVRSHALRPIAHLEIPPVDVIGVNALPSLQYPSDHLALETIFAFNL